MKHRSHPNRRRRLSGTAAGIGAATGGIVFAALTQLALAPSAQAQPDDPFADVFSDIQLAVSAGQTDFADGANYLADGNLIDALALDLTGTNNVVFGSGLDLVVDGTEALTGNPESGGFAFIGLEIPANFNEGIGEAQEYISGAQSSFDAALSDFAGGDLSTGLSAFADGTESLFAYAPDQIVLGLAESLLGGGGLVD